MDHSSVLDISASRRRTLQALDDVEGERVLMGLERGFQTSSYVYQKLHGIRPGSEFSRAAGLVSAKSHRLARSCVSLCFDSLGPESGAVLRVWREAIDLLAYLRTHPEEGPRQFFEIDLPKRPGDIAAGAGLPEWIKELRDWLNQHSSHLGPFGGNAWTWWRRSGSGTLLADEPTCRRVLVDNLNFVRLMLLLSLTESCKCLSMAGALGPGLYNRMEMLHAEIEELNEIIRERAGRSSGDQGGGSSSAGG